MKNRKIIKSIFSILCICAVLLATLPISNVVSGQGSEKLNFEQFADWQSGWGTVNDGIITWAEGKSNLAKEIIPDGRHALSEFETSNLKFSSDNGSAKGITDENLNPGADKGWFQFSAAGNPDKEPTTYPWRFTFDLGASKTIEEILIITHATNKQVMLNSFEIYVSNDLSSLYTTPAITVENVGENGKGYYSLSAIGTLNAKYVGLSVTDFNLLTNSDAHNAGVLLLREFAILGPESSGGDTNDGISYYADWQSDWGTLNNGKITWAEGKTNYVKEIIPSGSHATSNFNTTDLVFNSANGSAKGITDENLNPGADKGWFQVNAAGNPDKEPATYPWRFTFDLGASKTIEEILIITHATNKQVMLNGFEIYVSDNPDTLYTTPAITVEDASKDAKGYYSLKFAESRNAQYVGLSITDFNILTNSDAHNAGVLLLREFAVLGPESSGGTQSKNITYYSDWQSNWGTLNNGKITWADGKNNLVKGNIPSGSHTSANFNTTELHFNKENGSAKGITDENLNPGADKGWFQFNAAGNPDKEPTTYPWRFTFDLGNYKDVEEFLLITHATNNTVMLDDYEIYVSNDLDTLYTTPIAKAENASEGSKGYHYLKLSEPVMARYVGISITDFNRLTGTMNNSGVLLLREFAVFGKDSPNAPKLETTFSKTFPSSLGTLNDNKIVWNSSKLNMIRNAIPIISNSADATESNVSYKANEKRDLLGLTDANLETDGWTQLIINDDIQNEPDGHIYISYDMGSVCSINEILLSTHDLAKNNFMLCDYKIYISESFDTLYSNNAFIITKKTINLDEGFHHYEFESQSARYIGIEICDLNPLYSGIYGAGLLTIKEFAVLGEKSNSHELMRMQVVTPPNKTEYLPGGELDLTGISLLGCYSDGVDVPISIEGCTVSGYDANKIGEQTITLSYLSHTASFKVLVATTGVVCADADVTNEYLKSLGKNHLNGKKMQVINGKGKSVMATTSEDGKGIWKADNLTDSLVSTDSKDLVRIRFDTSEDMPCSIIYDMSQSITISEIAVIGHVSTQGDFQLSTYRVYVADSRDGLIDDKNLVLSYDNTGKWNEEDGGIKGSAQVFKIMEKPKGRFVAFVFDKNSSATEWGESRQFLRELGIYGEADYGVPTNLLANTIVSGHSKLLDRNNLNILSDNDYGTDKYVDFNANGEQIKLLYDLGAGKNLTEFRLAGGSDDVGKLINEFKIYASQTEDELLSNENMLYHFVREAGDINRIISYALPEEKDYQYVAFVVEAAADGSCVLSEVSAIGLSWQLNRIENLLFLSNSDKITPYIEDKTNYGLIRTNTFAQRENPNRADMSAYILDGNIGDVNVSLYGAQKGKETNNLLIDLEYSTILNEVDVYGIMHESLYNAKTVSVYIGASEMDVWGKDAKPVATYTDENRSGTMEIKFGEVIGRYIRICVDEGADVSVCHGSDLAVISEIAANGMSFNATNSVITMPSFKDEKTGITLDVLPLNYRDYYDSAVEMRVTLVNADEELACSLRDYGLRLSKDQYFKIELLNENGKVISNLGGRKVQISVPVTEEQLENLIYLAMVEDDSLVLTDSVVEENRFTYICENDSGTISLGFAEGYNYPLEEPDDSSDEPVVESKPEPIIKEESSLEENIPNEFDSEQSVESSDTVEDNLSDDTILETPSDEEDETKETVKKRRKKLIKYITEGMSVWAIILICLGAVLGLGIIAVFIILYIKKRKNINRKGDTV